MMFFNINNNHGVTTPTFESLVSKYGGTILSDYPQYKFKNYVKTINMFNFVFGWDDSDKPTTFNETSAQKDKGLLFPLLLFLQPKTGNIPVYPTIHKLTKNLSSWFYSSSNKTGVHKKLNRDGSCKGLTEKFAAVMDQYKSINGLVRFDKLIRKPNAKFVTDIINYQATQDGDPADTRKRPTIVKPSHSQLNIDNFENNSSVQLAVAVKNSNSVFHGLCYGQYGNSSKTYYFYDPNEGIATFKNKTEFNNFIEEFLQQNYGELKRLEGRFSAAARNTFAPPNHIPSCKP